MTTFSSRYNKTCGFTLVEVLIALVVLGFGLLGLTRLQGHIFKSGADAKARSVAVTIAQQKIDDLRRYTELSGLAAPGITDTYTAIGDNTGGTVAAGTITRPGNTYQLSWDVADWYYAGFNVQAGPTPPFPVPNYPAFKTVTVTVAWQDEAGVDRRVQIDTVVAPIDPRRSGLIANATASLYNAPTPGPSPSN